MRCVWIVPKNLKETVFTEYLEVSTCCTEWMENDEHCMQQLVLWLHQKQSWLNVHVSIPEFWGLKSPLLQGMYQSRNLQQCPMWEVQSPLRVGTVAGSPRHHKTLQFEMWYSGRCFLHRSYIHFHFGSFEMSFSCFGKVGLVHEGYSYLSWIDHFIFFTFILTTSCSTRPYAILASQVITRICSGH